MLFCLSGMLLIRLFCENEEEVNRKLEAYADKIHL